MANKPSERTKSIVRQVVADTGSFPAIRDYTAAHFPGLKAAILFVEGWPRPDVNTAMSIDLGDVPVTRLDRQYEFYLVAHPGWDIAQVLGDVGVRVRRGSVVPEPGEFILTGMLPTYPHGHVQHLAVVDPPIVALPPVLADLDPSVGFLQLVPFTLSEVRVLESDGKDALARTLRARGDDLLDFDRD